MIHTATAMRCLWCELPLVKLGEGEGFVLAECDQCRARYGLDTVMAERFVLHRGSPCSVAELALSLRVRGLSGASSSIPTFGCLASKEIDRNPMTTLVGTVSLVGSE